MLLKYTSLAIMVLIVFTTKSFSQDYDTNNEALSKWYYSFGSNNIGLQYNVFDDSSLNFKYSYDDQAYYLLLGTGRFTGFTFGYGTSSKLFKIDDENLENDDENLEKNITYFNLGINMGNNRTIVNEILFQDISVYVPIRINLNYQLVDYNFNSQESLSLGFDDTISSLNYLSGTFGLGFGVNYRTDRFFPFLEDRLLIDLHGVRGLGFNGEYISEDIKLGASRIDEVLFSITILELLGKTALKLGYRYRAGYSNQDSWGEILTMLTERQSFESKHVSNMFIIGFSF